jgi:hypothetical protein
MKMSQHKKIADYIEKYGSITQFEAYRDLGITYLTTRISEMRRNGLDIVGEWETGENRFGEPDRYMRYTIKGDVK